LASDLDCLLQADNRGALLLEGPALILVRDAEGDQLPVELRDLVLSLLQRRMRPFESSMLPLERRPGIDEGGPLLLELTLGLLAGGTLLPELLLRCDDRGGLAARAAFNSSASLALCSASRALSSACFAGTTPPRAPRGPAGAEPGRRPPPPPSQPPWSAPSPGPLSPAAAPRPGR
jgi:hypothetical protein